MKTQKGRKNNIQLILAYLQVIALGMPVLSFWSCAVPPAPMYGTRVPASTSSSSDSTSGSGSNYSSSINYPSYGSSSSPVTASSPTPSPSAAPTPTCSISTPQLKNYNNLYYYVDATLTVSSTTQVAYVSYTLSDSIGYGQSIGIATSAPYEVQYVLTAGLGASTLSATIVDVTGHSYQSACSTSYTINWN